MHVSALLLISNGERMRLTMSVHTLTVFIFILGVYRLCYMPMCPWETYTAVTIYHH